MSYTPQLEKTIELLSPGSSNASKLAEIHLRALRGDVLPAMGLHFLEDYYSYTLNLNDQMIFGCFDDEKLCGFCQVSYSPMSFIQVTIRSPYALLNIARLLITKPRMLWRGIRQASQRPKNITHLNIPEISFIAINESNQGRGLGKRLVEYVTRHSYELGFGELYTKTSNPIAKSLYLNYFDAEIIATEEISGNTYWYLIWQTANSSIQA